MSEHLSRLKVVFWILGGALLVVGMAGVWDRMQNGHHGAAYNNIVVWGQWVANYIYFIGLSAGAFLVSSMVYVFNVKRFAPIGRLAVFTALVTLLLALLSIVVDLGHMGRAWEAIIYANFKSPMAWMIYLYSFYTVILALEMWYLLRRDLVIGAHEPGWRGRVYRVLAFGSRENSEASTARDHKMVRVLATIGVPTAIMFHGGVGALFGTVAARPHWYSGLFPILFLVSALLSGGAVLVVAAAIFHEGVLRNRSLIIDLGRLVLGLLALDVLFQVSEFLVATRGGLPAHIEPLKLMLSGPYSGVFWIVQLGLGVVIPVVILMAPSRKNPLAVAFACALVAVGIYGLRLNIVIPGLAADVVHGLTKAVSTPRITAAYFPSATEWLLSMAVLGLGFLLFGAGEMLLPRDTLVHEE